MPQAQLPLASGEALFLSPLTSLTPTAVVVGERLMGLVAPRESVGGEGKALPPTLAGTDDGDAHRTSCYDDRGR